VKPSWQELYRVAVLETDAAKIEERIEAAELAIDERQLVLSEEGQAIDDAQRESFRSAGERRHAHEYSRLASRLGFCSENGQQFGSPLKRLSSPA
jgi:hypothetical protein